jgi:pimeloyl-ACP methyl ester carboxylesterase
VALLALAAVACAQSPAATQAPPTTLADFSKQRISWAACGHGLQCASIQVPIDYAHPAAGRTTIRLNRAPATGDSRGPLVMNPGGPGESGIDFVSWFARDVPRLHAAYDLIGFDPRGVGASNGLHCLDTDQLDELTSVDAPPRTAAEDGRAHALARLEGVECRRRGGALASHVTTIETARDMDIIRSALGSPRLDYYGASYGTYLGSVYAALFPQHVGRMVLDGAVDPELSHDQAALQQARGFQVELDTMVDQCVDKPPCLLGDSHADAVRAMARMLAAAARHPLPAGDDRPLTQGMAVYGIAEGLYWPNDWLRLTIAISNAEMGYGEALRGFSDEYWERGDHRYTSNVAAAYTAIDCLDAQTNPHQAAVPMARFRKASPLLGSSFKAENAICNDWPLTTTLRRPDLHLDDAPPIVVLSTTGDPATPYAWGVRLARELGSGVLVTRKGEGHTAYAWGNACIDNAVDAFLIYGVAPRNGLEC